MCYQDINVSSIAYKDPVDSFVNHTTCRKFDSPRATGRAYRRRMNLQKDKRLRKIISRHYLPHAGYLMRDETHILYPRSSSAQRWIKHQTSKLVRKANIGSGNFYRRVLDYWWILY